MKKYVVMQPTITIIKRCSWQNMIFIGIQCSITDL